MKVEHLMDHLVENLRKSANSAKPFGEVIKFDTGADGVVCIDGRGDVVTVDDIDKDAATTIILSRKNLEKLLGGKLNPAMAMMSGKLKVKGDMSLALKLTAFL